MNKITITTIIAALTLLMASCSSIKDDHTLKNTEVEYTFPGEWEKHEGTWLIWPHNYGVIVSEYVDMIDDVWVTMTKALHSGERVHIVAYDAQERSRISTLLQEEGVDMSQVDFLLAETDQFWARDCGPMFAMDSEGKPVVLDWGFNGYARMDKLGPDVPEEYRWEMPEFVREDYLENYVKDDILAERIADLINIECVNINQFILEGGAIESDGCGTIITTESCILNENRNPGVTRKQAEIYFKKYLGATNVIQLEGTTDEDITDGHIDGLVRFADANTIVTTTKEDYFETYDYTPRGDYSKVINAKNAAGKKYNIVTLPITAEDVEWLGQRANYLNYYAGNDVVLVPVYDDVMDAEALRILGEIYPDKEIIPINGEVLALLGGGIHCVTQQQPIFSYQTSPYLLYKQIPMTLEFGTLNRKELRQAAELAARAFSDYEYFTNWFPDPKERAKVESAIIWCSYKTNFSSAPQLTAKLNGKIVALAELNAPDHKDPSVLSYILHGWLKVYMAAGLKRVNDWIAMDAAASKPCHDYQKTAPGIWYLSSLSTDPSMQGIGLGTKLMDYYENYIREHGGKQVVLVTNSQKNLNFYLKRGYEVFDEQVFEYNGHKIGSWSMKKVL